MPEQSTFTPAHLQRSLYAALGGTFFLRVGGGVMGILTGLFLAAKNVELGGDKHPFHISATLAGLIIASFFITELGGSFISGGLIDRHGPRRYMILGPLFGAAAMILTGLLHLRSTSTFFQFILFLGMLLIARLLEGASAASANPASLAYIAAYTTDNAKLRSRISSYFELMTLIGAIVGFVIGGTLYQYFGQSAFLINTVFYLTSMVIFSSVHSVKSTGHTESHNLRAYQKLMTSPRLRELIPAWLAISAMLGVLFNHATFQLSNSKPRFTLFPTWAYQISQIHFQPFGAPPPVLSEGGSRQMITFANQTLSHAFNSSQVGYVFGIYAAAFGIGILIWSLLIPRMRKSTAMFISSAGVIASSIVIGLINHTGAIQEPSGIRFILLPLMIIAVMVESGFTPAALIYLSDISELHAENRGMVMGLYSFLLGFGQLVGTIIAGPFADWQGIDGLLIFMVILAVISLFSITLLRRDEEVTHQELGAGANANAVEAVS